MVAATGQVADNKLVLCIYDPLGTCGDAYGFAKDYVLQMASNPEVAKVAHEVYERLQRVKAQLALPSMTNT